MRVTLSLYYPAKPYITTQAWGIANPSYLQFGFSKHNGIDFRVDSDAIVRAMCDGTVISTGYNAGAGNFAYYMTDVVETDEIPCTVQFGYFHAAKVLVKDGQRVKAGDPIIEADNTGFSTGPHTHISAKRYGIDKVVIDTDPATNYTFDFSKYYNGKYADDVSGFVFTRNLEMGDNNEEVRELQKKLKTLGYFPAYQECTAYYGSITRKAVFAFQLDKLVLSPTEILWGGKYFGPKTRQALNLV